MMNKTMIERVAGILEPQAWAALGTGDTLAYQNRRTSSLRKARAAIEAMREPTLDILKASDNLILNDEEFHAGPYELIKAEWRAMIDAALQEPKP